MSIEDYDIISILGSSISSASYKVRSKTTNKILVWQTIDYSKLSDSEKGKLIKKIQKRINIKHPNVLLFYDYIDQKENKILYLIMDYCPNGSLKKLITYVKENKLVLQEEFVCKIIYQIMFALKTIEECSGNVSVNEVFFDADYNVKLYNYNFEGVKHKCKDIKMSTIGLVIFEMCFLKTYDKHSLESDIKDMGTVYSSTLLSIISHMIKDNNDVNKNMDKILCHPMLLLKSTKWTKEQCFLKITGEHIKLPDSEKRHTHNAKQDLRAREAAIRSKEMKLQEMEQGLIHREKKLMQMEKILNEKLMQAEQYLKKCKTGTLKPEKPQPNYENLDSTYVDCGDSIIMPTSKKLDVNTIAKPANFTRTLSERRIRFKGHSPLKEVDLNRRKSVKMLKKKTVSASECSSDWKTCSENDSELSSQDGTKSNSITYSKQLFIDDICENEYEVPPDCQPISWTFESKKYAFELLRIMNGSEKDNNANYNKEVRHTDL